MDNYLYNYDFVTNNPDAKLLDRMYEEGIRARKVQDGIWYLSASFIDHMTARNYCRDYGLAVQRFRKVKIA